MCVNLILSEWRSFVNPNEIHHHRMRRYHIHVANQAFGVMRRQYQHRAVTVAQAAECAGHSWFHLACAHGEFFFAVFLTVVADSAVKELHAVVHQDFGCGGDAVAVAVGAHHILYATFAVGHIPTAPFDVLRGALGVFLDEVFIGGDEVFVEDGIFLLRAVVTLDLAAARRHNCQRQ